MGSSRFAACLCLMISTFGLFSISARSRAAPSESHRLESAGELDALNAATRDLCGRDVVMLGENGYHGDGRTPAFKAALIQQLIRRCHFNAVFFEANHYDFLEFARRLRGGESTSPDMVSAAIGWKWSHDEEIAPLIPFLFAEARAGRVALGGLDDQVGALGALYSNDHMPDELTGLLDPAQRDTCRTLLVQRITHRYPGASPHSQLDYAPLRQCLADIRAAASAGSGGNRVRRQELVDMIANIERTIARDFGAVSQLMTGRDHSMFLNLRWMAARLPSRPRIIIWAANGHVAKETTVNPPYAGGRNLGSYVRETYGNRAFALGFTAASGSFRWDRGITRPIPPAPPGSLEARAMAGHSRDAAYLGPARLAAMGEIVGAAADDHQYVSARWAHIYDGVVVFRAERPPTRIE
jgi:erythromycin esterase-like protein